MSEVTQEDLQDRTLYTVLFGWGRTSPTQVQYIDDVEFIGGVARDVPGDVIKKWREKQPKMKFTVAPQSSDEPEWGRLTGIQPIKPEKIAAYIKAVDEQLLIEALGGEDQALQFADRIKKRVSKPAAAKR